MIHEDALIVGCSCQSMDHVVRFAFWPYDPDDPSYGIEAYVHVSLARQSLWRRIKTALRYVFRGACPYVDAAEVVLNERDFPALLAWVVRAGEDAKMRKEKVKP